MDQKQAAIGSGCVFRSCKEIASLKNRNQSYQTHVNELSLLRWAVI